MYLMLCGASLSLSTPKPLFKVGKGREGTDTQLDLKEAKEVIGWIEKQLTP
jgi:hypothetical protein